MTEEEEIRAYRKEAIKALNDMHEWTLRDVPFGALTMKREIVALSMGACAIERLNEIDFGGE